MEFEAYAGASTLAPVQPVTLDLSLEDLDAILEVDVVNTVPPDLNEV